MSLQSFFQFFSLLLYISTINGFSANPSAKESSSVIHFQMIHRHAPELLGEKKLTHSERIKELLHGDKVRMEILSHKRKLRNELGATSSSSSSRRRASQFHGDNSSFSFPLLSGSFTDTASYYVTFRVGTPPQEFLLLLDTGSDLTWMNCRLKSNQGNRNAKELNTTKRVFHPEHSKTFKTIPCNTTLCREDFADLMSNTVCPTPNSPCSYEYSYVSTEVAQGIFAYDTVTVNLTNGSKKKIPDMLIGCTQVWNDSNSLSKADGVFGLGFNSHSFVSNVYKKFHGKFSYCLMDQYATKNVTNYLTFGHRSSTQGIPPKMKFTTLGLIGDHFGVSVKGIYVNGVKLKIPAKVWDIEKGGGVVIDSGFSLTMWVQEAYGPIIAALEKPLLGKLKRVESENFDSCFKVPNTTTMYESLVPKLEIEFLHGVRLKPAVSSYFIDADDTGEVKCFGFSQTPVDDKEASESNSISILGSMMQQNHLWEFDILQDRLGFAPSSCVLPA
ncbi:aspartic proteinase NANA, chloroplast-like [Telopea speciosissima]|uniref:aspartic proteinase NANA, chloroplast-like n=1 Tax=Telopea speciosissima TaxID=54955 RepID=UPI001CC35BA3|nr:aspartic proteinase NANA, chloroplast-like [Telopea speciosissima]